MDFYGSEVWRQRGDATRTVGGISKQLLLQEFIRDGVVGKVLPL